MQLLHQILVACRIAFGTLRYRLWMSFSAIASIALVVIVLLGALALERGFKKVLDSASDDDVVIVRQDGVGSELYSIIPLEQQRLISAAPGLAEDQQGRKLVSRELYVVIDGAKVDSEDEANLLLRGVDLTAFQLREGLTISEGRTFTPGSREVVVGRKIASQYENFTLGSTQKIGTTVWTIVGIMESNGSAFESEIWASNTVVQSLYRKDNSIQIMRLKLANPDDIFRIRSYILSDPRLSMSVISESEYYKEQSATVALLVRGIGLPLTFIMAFGALAAAINTMYASVNSRSREISVLRMLGFSRISTFVSTIAESFLLCFTGSIVGAGVAWLVFNGLAASTLGGNFTQVMFELELGFQQLVVGAIFGAILGVLGGLVPAFKISRKPEIGI